jgi:hypothetical protein
MSEARALLEAALEGTIGVHRRLGVSYADMFAATKEGAELIRRADRPEARVAGACPECGGLDGRHLHVNLPAPRPPEPDRTLTERWKGYASHLDDCVAQPPPIGTGKGCSCGLLALAKEYALASLPSPRPPEPDRDVPRWGFDGYLWHLLPVNDSRRTACGGLMPAVYRAWALPGNPRCPVCPEPDR